MKTMLLTLLVLISDLAIAEPHTIHMMHQTSNVEAEDINHMFRFEPNYLRIEPGDTARFSGTVGEHTITSVQRMLPQGVEHIEINSLPSKDIKFDIPGIYGLKCRVHNRYGMVALLVVGEPVNLEEAKTFRLRRFGKTEMEGLLLKLEEEQAKLP